MIHNQFTKQQTVLCEGVGALWLLWRFVCVDYSCSAIMTPSNSFAVQTSWCVFGQLLVVGCSCVVGVRQTQRVVGAAKQ